MARRLESAYSVADSAETPDPLIRPGPTGTVGVSDEGLLVHIDSAESSARLVPWSEIRRVEPVKPGAHAVRVAGVGDVVVPSRLGRELWDRMYTPTVPGAGG